MIADDPHIQGGTSLVRGSLLDETQDDRCERAPEDLPDVLARHADELGVHALGIEIGLERDRPVDQAAHVFTGPLP